MSRGLLASLVVPSAAGMALAAEYVVFTDAQAPRFLLPALALLTIPAGFGLASVLARIRDRESVPAARAVAIVAAILVVVWGILQLAVATKVEAGVTEQRASAQRVGLRIRSLAAQRPCWVYSEVNFPIVGYAAGCRAAPLGKVLGSWGDRALHLEADGVRPFLVLLRARARPRPKAPPCSRRSRRARTCDGSSTAGLRPEPHDLHEDDPRQLGADDGRHDEPG